MKLVNCTIIKNHYMCFKLPNWPTDQVAVNHVPLSPLKKCPHITITCAETGQSNLFCDVEG